MCSQSTAAIETFRSYAAYGDIINNTQQFAHNVNNALRVQERRKKLLIMHSSGPVDCYGKT